MCYSARIVHDYRRYVREFGAGIALDEFIALFWRRRDGEKIKVAKALELAFCADPRSAEEREIADAIAAWQSAEALRLEAELFKQKKRLADAERVLAGKPTKKAAEDSRIAGEKIAWLLGKLADLRRTQVTSADDERIFPGTYAPVMVVENGRRLVRPMRYQCRPAGKPAFYDAKYPGTYNARRDSLGGFWKGLYGVTHAVVLASAFYENVSRPAAGGGTENVVLEFRPANGREMLVACLWSRWTGPGAPDLLSFAAITDEPPPEVAAAGHDRCIVPIRPEHLDAWLQPRRDDLAAASAILDDRERPFYEHRLAA